MSKWTAVDALTWATDTIMQSGANYNLKKMADARGLISVLEAVQVEPKKPTGSIDIAAEQLRKWLSDGLVAQEHQNALRLVVWAAKNLKVKDDPPCPYCDDTGDVHRADGEWRGTCTCPAGVVQVEPIACQGKNCGSTTPNLHSAECFAEHERTVSKPAGYVRCYALDVLGNGKGQTVIFPYLQDESDIPLYATPQQAAPGWQPIETVPMEGQESLCYTKELGAVVMYWDDPIQQWGTGFYDNDIPTPTHWMPLPAAPGAPV